MPSVLTPREKRLLIIGNCLVAAIILYTIVMLVNRRIDIAAERRANSIAALHEKVVRQNALKVRLESAGERAKAKVTEKSFDEQTQGFVKALEDASSQNGVGFSTFNPQPPRGRIAAGSKVQYDLKFGASHGSLVNFVRALEASGVPYAIESTSIKGNLQNPDSLEVTMTISFYYLEPMKNDPSA